MFLFLCPSVLCVHFLELLRSWLPKSWQKALKGEPRPHWGPRLPRWLSAKGQSLWGSFSGKRLLLGLGVTFDVLCLLLLKMEAAGINLVRMWSPLLPIGKLESEGKILGFRVQLCNKRIESCSGPAYDGSGHREGSSTCCSLGHGCMQSK